MRAEDFRDDTKDAGEIGAGHTVTALYELTPADPAAELPVVEALKYQQAGQLSAAAEPGELLTLKLRYKAPDGHESLPLEFRVVDRKLPFSQASLDCQFASAVAAFGMLLRDSPHKGNSTFNAVLEIAESSQGSDANGYRREFVELVRKARQLNGGRHNL